MANSIDSEGHGGRFLGLVSEYTASLRQNELLKSLPFLAIPAVLVGVFVYGSLLWNVLISFTHFSGFGSPSYASLSLDQYGKILTDPTFINAARNTAVLMVGFTVLCLFVGLGLAILVDRNIRFEGPIRTIYLLPMSLSFVVTSIFWAWMFNPQNGVLNYIFGHIGLGVLTLNWLGNPTLQLLAVIIALIWQFSGLAMIIYLAGLRKVPTDQYEAARLDGAGIVIRYVKIIIPQLKTSTFSAGVMLLLFSLKAFDFIYVLFGVNPGPGVDILPTMMYREAFQANSWAYGSAVAVVLLVATFIAIIPYMYYQYTKDLL